MEYKIGCLSNLISGTKNHTKSVVFQEYCKPKKVVSNNILTSGSVKKKKGRKRSISSETKVEYPQKKLKKQDGTGVNTTEKSSSFVQVEKKNETSPKEESNSINAQKRLKNKKKVPLDPEKEARTVFVKNLPLNMKPPKIEKLFKKFGEVESVRLRCAPLADPRVPKKVAIIKSQFHPERSSICAFVRFTSPDSVTKALEASGISVADHHIMIDRAIDKPKHDQRKAIFVGNVPFSAEEDELWKLFEPCGKIMDVRIIRDRKTGIGKGFAYINFESPDAVELALNLSGTSLKDRELRISRILQKKKQKNRNPSVVKKEKEFSMKNKQNNSQENKPNIVASFQGTKILDRKKLKKKNKLNKAELKKKIIMKKLTHTPKK